MWRISTDTYKMTTVMFTHKQRIIHQNNYSEHHHSIPQHPALSHTTSVPLHPVTSLLPLLSPERASPVSEAAGTCWSVLRAVVSTAERARTGRVSNWPLQASSRDQTRSRTADSPHRLTGNTTGRRDVRHRTTDWRGGGGCTFMVEQIQRSSSRHGTTHKRSKGLNRPRWSSG